MARIVKVFVAGATGALGREIVPLLQGRGHEVVGLARSVENERLLRAAGARAARAEITDVDALARAMEGCDVVVRAATHIPKVAWTPEEVAQNDRVRRDGTRALLDAARKAGASYYVQESVTWSSAEDPATATAVDAERAAAAAPVPSATLRLAWLYGAGSAHTRQFASALIAGRFVVPARAVAPRSFLHLADAGLAFALAIERRPVGAFDVADREPVAAGAFFDAFADALGLPPPARDDAAPAGFLGLADAADATAFARATGWSPRYPDVRAGLREVAQALRAA